MEKKRLIIAMVMVFFVIMAVNSNNVFADKQGNCIIESLDQITYLLENQVIPKLDECCGCEIGVPKTGQTTSYATGDDGDYEKGIPWPEPRFTDHENGTVTDNLTGLIWLKNANCFGTRIWTDALSECNGLASGACGLTDGSVAGDWRLPNVRELQSLIDYGTHGPALPSGHPFSDVQSAYYWSGTTYEGSDTGYHAWYVSLGTGHVHFFNEDGSLYVWPVRGAK